MIINISKALKLSLVFAVCAGQGVYAMDGIRSSLNHMVPQAKEGFTHAMAFAKSVRGERIVRGLGGATLGLYGVRADCSKKLKAFFVLSGLGVTALSSIRLNPQEPEIPAALFGSVGGALNFLGAQNFNQCLTYGALTVGCGFANPVLREMITQNPKLAAGFALAAGLGKVAHLKIRDRQIAAAKEAAAKEAAAKEAAAKEAVTKIQASLRAAAAERQVAARKEAREAAGAAAKVEAAKAIAIAEGNNLEATHNTDTNPLIFGGSIAERGQKAAQLGEAKAAAERQEAAERQAFETEEECAWKELLKSIFLKNYHKALSITKNTKNSNNPINSTPAGTPQVYTPRRTGYWNTDLYTLGNGRSLNGMCQIKKK